MSRRVYGWEDNPAVDSCRFRLSTNRAKELVDSGRASYIKLADGRQAVQFLFSGPEERETAGTFQSAWRKKLSGSRILNIPYVPVWQMRPQAAA